MGTKDRGFAVREGVPPGIKDPGLSFTLKTPDRNFHFAVEREEDMMEWLRALKGVIEVPMSPQETSSMSLRANHYRS